MSFLDWIYSSYPNPGIEGAWGPLHIIVMVLMAAFIVVSSLLLRKKSEKSMKNNANKKVRKF